MNFADLHGEFAPPQISAEEAERVFIARYGFNGTFSALGGERDQNFRVKTDCGRQLVLKISGEAESREAIDLQAQILDHLEATAVDANVPKGVRTRNGELYFDHRFDSGAEHVVRVVTFVDGSPLPTAQLSNGQSAFDVGRLQGRICRAMASFFHPAALRAMPWDIGNGLVFADEFLTALKRQVASALAPHLPRLQGETLPALRRLRSQIIHNDVHSGNVLVDASGKVAGLIDFGDALFAPLIQELAVSAASLAEICHCDPSTVIAELERGFHTVFPLQREERDLLLDAAILRSLLCVELGSYKAGLIPNSEHQSVVHAASVRGLLALLSLRNASAALSWKPLQTEHTVERRKKAMSPTYRFHYDEPLHIVRGEGTLLYDAEGREYLDCYNNVPSVGHCNPYVVDALERQAATLNTHTRYLHHEIVRYAERLSATFPDDIDTCMFVCTGTEANDLAYKVARTVTGKHGAIVSMGAYHGNSVGIADISIEAADRDAYPPHVEPIALPDTYRGCFSCDEPELGQKLAGLAEEAIARLAGSPHGLAMLMIDAIFDAPGIFTAPPHYLSELFARVRRAGGLVVVDEVQSGLCRLGDNFWGFQDSDVIPDIVTMGKPMGNGHPLAVVAAKRQVLDAFASKEQYFNTFGGNPVSAAVGNAVLDVVEDQEILESVNRVGKQLRSGLKDLISKHDVIGDIRGKGLFLGIDLVGDRDKRTPWSAAAHQLVNRLRHRGVLVSVNGAYDNVIKIRPPLVFSTKDADRLVGAIDAELAIGITADKPQT